MKKVSVVIPAYNAEKTIGRCLDSVLGQRYSGFEVVVINDGSTDKTLEICENYTKLDDRFRVFTIRNGGVSNARNVGIEKSSGQYLTFVDSDDMIHPDYLKKMVDAIEQYDTDLVISDLVLIDFGCPEKRVVLSGRNFTDKVPAVLGKADFDEKIMELIWKTSLMESGCGKLMNLEIWKKHNIKLDTNLSLGEDFSANLEYYKYANGVVFLNQPLYYYNNVDDSDSLSHKYRPDLFRVKMKLVDNLKNYLGDDVGRLSKKELKYYYNYVAAYGLNALETLVNDNHYQGRKEKMMRMEEIVENEEFVDAVKKATYLKYPKWKPMIIEKNVRKLMTQKTKEMVKMDGPLKNRVARRLAKFYFCDMRGDKKRGIEIDNKLASIGISGTIKSEFGKKL